MSGKNQLLAQNSVELQEQLTPDMHNVGSPLTQAPVLYST